MRAVVYARYSTDKQSESSIEDQVRLCMVRVEYEEWNLKEVYQDEGVSGSVPVAQRVGGVKLLADSMAKNYDVLVLEGLDRLSRDLVEQETIVRRLEHRGIRILGLSDGYDTNQKGRQLVRGMRGLINEMYLEDLKYKTHRGMSGQVARGFAAGGAAFGYINVKEEEGSRIVVDEQAAEWVRWIFEHFVKGWAIKRIVEELNRLGVRSPRGKNWGVSAVYGSPNKGSGILNNELYIGRHIWNRSRWVKDPDTGSRSRVENPESEWMIEDHPELRIVPQALWQAARDRMNTQRSKSGMRGKGAKTRTLLSGLLSCGHCGGTVTAVNSHSYGCSNHKYQGNEVCGGVSISKKIAEVRLMTEIREMLLNPEIIKYVHQETKKQLNEIFKSQRLEKNQILKKLGDLEGQIERYIDAIGSIGISESLTKKLRAAEAEKETYLVALSNTKEKVELPKLPDVKKRYKEMVMDLQKSLGEDLDEARQHLIELLGTIRLYKEGNKVLAELEASQAVLLKTAGLSPAMVAGAGFVCRKQLYLK